MQSGPHAQSADALGFGPERYIPDKQPLDGLGAQCPREEEALGMRTPEPFEFARLDPDVSVLAQAQAEYAKLK